MLNIKIDAAKTLGPREAAIIEAKLRNPDGVSAVPFKVTHSEPTLHIGIDDREFADDPDFIGRKLGYRVHSV
jgi:hypothetical protein